MVSPQGEVLFDQDVAALFGDNIDPSLPAGLEDDRSRTAYFVAGEA